MTYRKLGRILLFAAGMMAGNRLYNHVDAWLGMAIIVTSATYFIYVTFKKTRENETEN